MKSLYYNSFANSVSHIYYDIKLVRQRSEIGKIAIIHIYQPSHSGTTLINGDEYRDDIINRILEDDLKGVVLHNIRVIYTTPKLHDELLNIEFVLRFNIDDVRNSVTYPRTKLMQRVYLFLGKTVETSCLNMDIKAGEVRVFTDLGEGNHIHTDGLPEFNIDTNKLKNYA